MKKKKKSRAHKRKPYLNTPPTALEAQNVMADEMIRWVKSNDVFLLDSFPIALSIAPCRFYALANNNEYFADALNYSRHLIAERMIKMWVKKELDKELVTRLLPIYHQEFREYMMLKIRTSEMAKEDAKQKIQVTYEAIPNSPLVKELKKVDNEA